MKIKINKAKIIQQNGTHILEYVVTKNDSGKAKDFILRFGFESEYSQFTCNEVADGVIVMLLPFAIRGGYDIESEAPVTEELFYRLQYQLIPQLSLCLKRRGIRILCEKVKPNWKPYAVATAMSCGVDSFATLFEYLEQGLMDTHKITHLTFFQNGAHHSGCVGHFYREGEVFQAQLQHVKKYCDENGRKLIVITSNLDEFLSEFFWNDSFDRTHTFRNLGFVLLLQKLIKTYYYSPGHNVDDFRCDLLDDSALYDRLILPNVSSDFTCFYNSNGSMTRIEKIKYISSFKETYNNLLVCYVGDSNCGNCLKCRRTMLELYYSGHLDKYANSFPVDEFLKNLKKHIIWFLSKRRSDSVMRQISDYAKENGIHIPRSYYLMADLRSIAQYVLKIIKGNRN